MLEVRNWRIDKLPVASLISGHPLQATQLFHRKPCIKLKFCTAAPEAPFDQGCRSR